MLQHTIYTVDLLGSKVEAHNRLHALRETRHHHDKKRVQTACYTIDTYTDVAIHSSLNQQRVVDDNDNDTATHIDEERAHANGNYVLDDLEIEDQSFAAEMREIALVEEEPDGIDQAAYLTQDSGKSCSSDSEVKSEDEDWVKDKVDKHRYQVRPHRLCRIARRTKLVAQSKEDMGDDIARYDDLHIVVGIRECLVARTEQSKDRVKEEQSEDGEAKRDGNIHTEHIAEDDQTAPLVVLAHRNRSLCRTTHTKHCSKST